MLEIKNISKIYETDNFKQKALDKVSINFRKNEFVSILGPSGSGKTTLLNIIGGLDKYTTGDLIINGVSTKKYKDRDWDTYRNHKIGFVFQSYNLISHQTVLSNVELALTLSGVSKKERRRRAIEALNKVGLKEHKNKLPNQLSGGQMQRIAIARALVNNPDILLADEPTGALDSKTSVQIMELLKEVANDRLVIMVTHNSELADTYSTRIIKLKDGVIEDDTMPYQEKDIEEPSKKKSKKTNMSFKTALALSLNNLMTKKGRTILTSFAGSIGIIGIALILSLSNGVEQYISNVQRETLTSYPIEINSNNVDFAGAMLEKMHENKEFNYEEGKIYSNNTLGNMLSTMSSSIKTNNLQAFKGYLENNKEITKYTSLIDYGYNVELQLYKDNVLVSTDKVLDTIGFNSSSNVTMGSSVFSKLFNNNDLSNSMYDIIAGKMPTSYDEVVILVDKNNRISDYTLYALGLKDIEELKEMYQSVINQEKIDTEVVEYTYEQLLGLNYKLLLNTDYYEKIGNIWVDKRNNQEYINSKLKNALDIKVVGIIKLTSENQNTYGSILYTDALEKYIIEKNNDSQIVKEQLENKNINLLTGLKFSDKEFNINSLSTEQKMYLNSLSSIELAQVISEYQKQAKMTYENVLDQLGYVQLDNPKTIYIYAKDFESKNKVKDIINDYNNIQKENQKEENIISYNDMVGLLMSSVTSIIDMISYVLIGFVSISLIVSSIMIGIITYISVLERTKEIGILRAIGASKKDVSRVFNAETLIVGLASGIIGILVTLLLNIPINMIINALAGVNNITKLPTVGAIILIIISVLLTLIAGLIPSRMASKKDPVVALRSE